MCVLERLWEKVDIAIASKYSAVIVDVFNEAMMHGSKEKHDKHEFYYAAGYAAYMHPEGGLNAYIRGQAEEAFLMSLFWRPGFLPSVLYLAFIKMDEKKFLSALELLYSCGRGSNEFDMNLIDRFNEGVVCCLIECGYWSEALRSLRWFDSRIEEDAQVGVDLINFMKIVDKTVPDTELKRNVINGIKAIMSPEKRQ